jgi:CBS domain-containing protein
MKAVDVMTTSPVSVSPQNSIRHAIQIMLHRKVSGLPVLDDDGRLVGIITEGDLLRRMELGIAAFVALPSEPPVTDEAEARAYVKSHGWSVADVMTRDPVTVEESMPIHRIAAMMSEQRIKRMPVMRGGDLVGIVSRADLLHAVATVTLDETAPGDIAIRLSVQAYIAEVHGIKGADLSLTVADGVVHLWGVVSSPSGKEAARVAAEGVRGVEGVVNHLSIARIHLAPSVVRP